MQSTLESLLNKYYLYNCFRQQLLYKGYSFKDLDGLNMCVNQFDKLIYNESMSILNDLLRKTYYRLLLRIDKGYKNLIEIVENPGEWVLNPIEKDKEAWISDKVLIFTTETKCAVFSHVSRNSIGAYKYQDNKWQ
jgi:hypothetical protein